MATQEVPVKANLNIVLKSDTEQLEEVMVVAYGTAKKSAFTGSAATIKNEKIVMKWLMHRQAQQASFHINDK